jgi:23S rRNA (cytosine1962-C5)-methyltransferase
VVRENGVRFSLSFREGYSAGLFLDQRENRRRLLSGHLAAGFDLSRTAQAEAGKRGSEPSGVGGHFPAAGAGTGSGRPPLAGIAVLNAFAYTCGFSVCAATRGAHTTSLDLSGKYLEWGQRNFQLNALDPAGHEFIQGDAFDWFRRLAKRKRLFDVIVLDPPTFSRSKGQGVFRAEKDYARLVSSALPLLKPNGVLLAATNAANLAPEKFLARLTTAIHSASREILQQYYGPQPPDFPANAAEPAYLNTTWLRIE